MLFFTNHNTILFRNTFHVSDYYYLEAIIEVSGKQL